MSGTLRNKWHHSAHYKHNVGGELMFSLHTKGAFIFDISGMPGCSYHYCTSFHMTYAIKIPQSLIGVANIDYKKFLFQIS